VLGRRARVTFLSRHEIFDGVPLLVGNFMASQHDCWPRWRMGEACHRGGLRSIVGVARLLRFHAYSSAGAEFRILGELQRSRRRRRPTSVFASSAVSLNYSKQALEKALVQIR